MYEKIPYTEEEIRYYSSDNYSISQISDILGCHWDYVQIRRQRFRKENGLPPLNRAQKPGRD